LQVSLVAFSMYAAARLFQSHSSRAAITLGAALGLLVLTRGWVVPLALWLALFGLAAIVQRTLLTRLAFITLPAAALIGEIWPLANYFMRPFDGSPTGPWMQWNYRQLGLPSMESFRYLLKYGIWFSWPAWPYAAWAVYAWRKQRGAIHIMLPLAFFAAFAVLATLNPYPEEGMLLPLLPPLAILAAFGLPTMKRGAINAVDWFAVMTLTTCAAFIWIGWIAKQTGWPAQLARNAFRLAPGFKPEFNLVATIAAAFATIGWIMLVHWRISRRPSVLWRAVVLSSGGVILCWLLLMTLWLPWINYGKSYAGVAHEIARRLPADHYCVDANVGPAQRASFAYFGQISFATTATTHCEFLLLQDKNRNIDNVPFIVRFNERWQLLWEGHRPADRDERYRLYRRVN
ncbi:MAG: glycosyltransferase, partial [Noviherbaspirillum sp.]|nr:glycosyltransferase [Noviherbaspirillum sp.]